MIGQRLGFHVAAQSPALRACGQRQNIIAVDRAIDGYQKHGAFIGPQRTHQLQRIFGDHPIIGVFTGKADQVFVNAVDVGGGDLTLLFTNIHKAVQIHHLGVVISAEELTPGIEILRVVIGVGTGEILVIGIVPNGRLGGRQQFRAGQVLNQHRIVSVTLLQEVIGIGYDLIHILHMGPAVAHHRTNTPRSGIACIAEVGILQIEPAIADAAHDGSVPVCTVAVDGSIAALGGLRLIPNQSREVDHIK